MSDHWETGDLSYLDFKEPRSWLRHPWQTFQWWIIYRNTVAVTVNLVADKSNARLWVRK